MYLAKTSLPNVLTAPLASLSQINITGLKILTGKALNYGLPGNNFSLVVTAGLFRGPVFKFGALTAHPA